MLARDKQGISRLLIVQKADIKIKVIKMLIRISYDVKAMSEAKYITSETSLIEIGKMIGGWIKYLEAKRSP